MSRYRVFYASDRLTQQCRQYRAKHSVVHEGLLFIILTTDTHKQQTHNVYVNNQRPLSKAEQTTHYFTSSI